MVQIQKQTLNELDLPHQLLPKLQNHVFHVTSLDRFQTIERSACIRANADGTLGNTYQQSAISFGRKKGYVCLFDLRNKTGDAVQGGLERFYFLAPPPLGADLAFLILAPGAYSRLLYWKDVKDEAGPAAFRIPEVECWYPGDMPICCVERVLLVNVVRRPPAPGALAEILHDALESDGVLRKGTPLNR